jgi:adenylate cyclase
VTVSEALHSFKETDDYRKSPVVAVYATRSMIRRRLADPECPDDFAILRDLRAQGATDYAAFPLIFTDGTIHVATWSTRQLGGFTAKQFADLASIIAPLARVAEIRALRRTSENLIDTYVGHQTGERILSGKIRRGYVEAIRAAIWLSDMRGVHVGLRTVAAAGADRPFESLFRLPGAGRARSRRRGAQIHGRRPLGNLSHRRGE